MVAPADGRAVHRRRFIRWAGSVGTVGLAGCLGGRPGSPADTPEDTPADTPTDAPGDPPSTFTVTATRCGNQANRATVTFGEDAVTVVGTIWGNDACYTARLDGVELDGGTLAVHVTAVRPDDVRGCAQCISEIDYRATVEVASPPFEVVVVHRGEPVATARP